jgi:hypothetical protein
MEELEKANPITDSSGNTDSGERASRDERLRAAHAHAVSQIERDRQRSGQLTTGINSQVGRSILEAGVRALTEDDGGYSPFATPRQFVVAAPPGTGKTSHAIALMAATVHTADTDDLSKPYGCLFVVDQIRKADDIFRQIDALLPGQVAVWTTDHNRDVGKPTQLFVPPERRFHVDQLEQRAIAVVTQAVLRGPRGDKARQVLRGGHRMPRALTIFDEQTREVEIYDVQQSDAVRVKEDIERHLRRSDIKAKMEPLLDFIHIQSKRTGNTIETPNDDPDGWRVARELAWFSSDETEQVVLSNSRDIKNLDKVFGFAAQMYNNYAFIFRQGGGENGTHFMAYVPAAVPTNNSVLLDASADIDKVSQLCSWRSPVPVPEVSFNNLRIVHVHPLMSGNLNELFRKEANRRDYAAHAIKVIKELMPVGVRGLVICKKALVDHGEIPKTTPETAKDRQSTNPFTWDLDGRHLAVTWWGGHGIGVNDWKEAEYVF